MEMHGRNMDIQTREHRANQYCMTCYRDALSEKQALKLPEGLLLPGNSSTNTWHKFRKNHLKECRMEMVEEH